MTEPLAATALSLGSHARIEFGVGAIARLAGCVDELGSRRVLLVTDAGLRSAGVVARVVALLEAAGLEVTVHDAIAPNPTTATLDEAAGVVRGLGDCVVVALGGGSVLDAAKGIALLGTNPGSVRSLGAVVQPGLPVVAVPTTAGTGAETNGFGVIEDERACRKVYVGDDSVRPRVSVLDPELTVGLPPGATAATGMDALVHGIESLASRGSNPMSAAYATEAVRLVSGSLAAAVDDGTDLEARAAAADGRAPGRAGAVDQRAGDRARVGARDDRPHRRGARAGAVGRAGRGDDPYGAGGRGAVRPGRGRDGGCRRGGGGERAR